MKTTLPLDRVNVLRRIRSLRVERAMRQAAGARAAVDAADSVVTERLEQVDAIRHALDELREAIGPALAPHLPRWASLTFARQHRLADQLERAEDKLLTARERLADTRKSLQRARAELAKARWREQVADDLARRAQRQRVVELERGVEREAEARSSHAQGTR
jgi:hypothetical protein